MSSVETIHEPRLAATILAHPLRPRILAAAREPISAADLARRLDLPRQRINYHVRQLAAAGFLKAVGRQPKRNMFEQQYVASAGAYVLAPAVLTEVAPEKPSGSDLSSAEQLLGVCTHAQADLARLAQSAQQAGLRVRTFGVEAEVYFQSAEQRAEFNRALEGAVRDVVARHSAAGGNRFRLIVGCYPAG